MSGSDPGLGGGKEEGLARRRGFVEVESDTLAEDGEAKQGDDDAALGGRHLLR